MKIEARLFGLLALLPSIYMFVVTVTSVEWTLISVLGFVSLSTTLLPPRYQWLTLTVIYVPAMYAVYDLVTSRDLLLLDLAGGYVISLPMLVLSSALQARTISGLVGSYLSSIVVSMVGLFGMQLAEGNPRALLYVLVSSLLRGQTGGQGSLDPSIMGPFVPMMAISLTSLLLFAHQRLGLKSESLYGNLLMSAVGSIALLAIVVYYSMNFSDGVAVTILLVALAVLFGGSYAAIATRR
ncbi:MAG: hypothetical protein NZ988_01065 [Thaumarchaeota archaeon]|nr:hypothetical protein [Candidatus Calditenuaceae archaeon]MDW8186623.1 hypothetical protein [Nitrososphaerota archaeon]